MADWDKILKCWATVEADLPYFGDILMTRAFTKYPEIQRLGDSKILGLAPRDMAGNQYVTHLGVIRLRHIGDMIKAKGNLPFTALTGPASMHITEVLGDIMAEKCGLDAAGQRDFKKVMAVVWEACS